jgi:hypothetical protein
MVTSTGSSPESNAFSASRLAKRKASVITRIATSMSRKRSGTKPFGRRLDHRGFLGFSRFALMSADLNVVNSALKAGSKSD